MLQVEDYFTIQTNRLNIALYLSGDDNVSLQDIVLGYFEENDENLGENLLEQQYEQISAEDQLNYLYEYMEKCAKAEYFDRYFLLINRFVQETNFLQNNFGINISKEDFLNLIKVYSLNTNYHDKAIVTNFITNNINIFKPFKNSTLTKNSTEIILRCCLRLLVSLQRLSYEDLLTYKNTLLNIYDDIHFFINKKKELETL